MNQKSENEKKRFLEYKQNYISGKWKSHLSEKERIEAYRERLSGYICSLVLGRDFLESCDAYFQRIGLAEFVQWADMELFRTNTHTYT